MSGRFIPTMLGINMVLAGVLGAMWLGPQGALRHTQWQAPAPQAPNLDDALQAVLEPNPALKEQFPEIVKRPVFSPDRRLTPPPPPEGAKAPPPPPPIALDSVVLTGIVSGRAFTGVLAQVEGESRVLKRGDKVGEWAVGGIKGRDVRFTKGDETRTLVLPNTLIDAPSDAAKGAPKPDAQATPLQPKVSNPTSVPVSSKPLPSRPAPPSATPASAPAPTPASASSAAETKGPVVPFGGSVGARRRPASDAR